MNASSIPLLVDKNVEKIISQRVRRVDFENIEEFLVRWEGYDKSHDTWEPKSNLKGCLRAIYNYKQGIKHEKMISCWEDNSSSSFSSLQSADVN